MGSAALPSAPPPPPPCSRMDRAPSLAAGWCRCLLRGLRPSRRLSDDQLLELELVITERHVSSYVCSLEPSPSRVSRAQTCTTTYTCASFCTHARGLKNWHSCWVAVP